MRCSPNMLYVYIGRFTAEVDVSDAARHAGRPSRAFECVAVPVCGDGGRFIGALQEVEQGGFRIRRGADDVVGEQELAQRLAEECAGGLHRELPEAGGWGVGVGIKGGEVGAVAAGPESGAADLVRIGFAHDLLRNSRSGARKGWGAAAGEAGD